MNIYDIVLIFIIAAALVMAVRSVKKAHKNGGCCGGCSGCPHECSCKQK